MDQNPYDVGNNLTRKVSEIRGPKFERVVHKMQITWAAFVTVIFVLISVVLIFERGDVFNFSLPKLDAMIVIGFGFVSIATHFIPSLFADRLLIRRKRADDIPEIVGPRKIELTCRWFRVLFNQDLTGLAFTSMLNLYFAWSRNSGFNFGVAVILAGLMLTQFPTRSRVSAWVQRKFEILGMSFDPDQTEF